MGSWTRTPAFPGRVHRLLAVAVAAGCWLAVPSGASAQQGPALNVSGLTSAATSTVANTGSAVETTVTAAAPVAGPAQDAVKQVAGTVGRVTGAENSPPLRLRDTAASDRPARVLPGPGAERFSSVFTPLIPGPPIGLPGTPAGGGDGGPSSAPSGALELPADSERAAGVVGGSSAAGASVSFLLGGLALLLATLSLAGPALRRRLPRRPVMGWPAAFVPLLERPG